MLFIVDGDMTQSERDALVVLGRTQRPLLLVLNKADRYSPEERERLLQRLREHAGGLVAAENVLACAAAPARTACCRSQRTVANTNAWRPPRPTSRPLRARLLAVAERCEARRWPPCMPACSPDACPSRSRSGSPRRGAIWPRA